MNREEISEREAKKLRIIPPTKANRPCDTEIIVWDAFTQVWNAYISARVELAEANHKLAIAHDAIPHLTGKLAASEQRVKEMREALRELMEVVAAELTGAPKNVPKSSWAEQWDKAEAALKRGAGCAV